LNDLEFTPAHACQLLVEAMQVVKQFAPEASTRAEKKQMALAITEKSVRQLGGFDAADGLDRQIVDYIVSTVLPKLVDIIYDVKDGQYDVEIEQCKDCCASCSSCCIPKKPTPAPLPEPETSKGGCVIS
jgi:hypothetical protein